ncbi:MAG: hypothetical protein GEU93_09095 [Propionibacteriales bacterium]|nr:hypothetical protein [Propionibacteriales bacterium]
MIDHYAVNKFLYDTDRNEHLVRRYIDDPDAYVDWYFDERLSRLLDNESEQSAVESPDEATRTALKTYDCAMLYRDGAHPFILWTLMLPIIEAKLASGEFVVGEQPENARAENRKPMAYYRERILPHGRPDFRY